MTEQPRCDCGQQFGIFLDDGVWKCPLCLMMERDRLRDSLAIAQKEETKIEGIESIVFVPKFQTLIFKTIASDDLGTPYQMIVRNLPNIEVAQKVVDNLGLQTKVKEHKETMLKSNDPRRPPDPELLRNQVAYETFNKSLSPELKGRWLVFGGGEFIADGESQRETMLKAREKCGQEDLRLFLFKGGEPIQCLEFVPGTMRLKRD